MVLFFWISLFILFYAFAGYGILLYILVKIKRLFVGRNIPDNNNNDLPTLTLIVAAYNEADYIRDKIRNTLALRYPPNKLDLIFITDGSSDKTPIIISEYPTIQLMHLPERSGKINAVHRAMKEVKTDIVVFTDANTFLNEEALTMIACHYATPTVGAVAGEKRVSSGIKSDATAGEGIYWKYESQLKKWDSELKTTIGAAGELFSIRRLLYEPVASDTLLDDFMISMNIVMKGYSITYEPNAYAIETSSANTREELKRKIRISAGGIQSIMRLTSLLNIFKYPILSFQYISHRVLRWTITPFLMIAVFVINLILIIRTSAFIYLLLFWMQFIFYNAALLGWLLGKREIKNKFLFIPFYFCLMNYAVVAGMIKYFKGNQHVKWDKAKRK